MSDSVVPESDLFDFQRGQTGFAAHLRNPELNPAPSAIESRRMKIYADLVYKNIENFLSSGFPIIRKITADDNWHKMVRDFISTHRSQTPFFLEIGAEFLDYLSTEREVDSDPPFLLELARYEWAELALYVADVQLPEDINTEVDEQLLLDCRPVVSPLAWSMVFSYPVHEIGPANQPQQPAEAPVCLVVYRNREESVGFMQANPVTARLLELCEAQGESSGREILTQIAFEMSHPNPEVVISGGLEILAQLHSLDIILGVYP